MKKSVALLLALIMLFAMFAACGKKETDSGKDNSVTGTPTTSTSTQSGGSDSKDTPSINTNTVDLNAQETKTYPSDDAKFVFTSQANIDYLTQTGNGFSPGGTGSLFFGEGLLRWNSDKNEVEPFLAESYEWISDKTMRLHLRKDVTSILGDPFTASDVIFSWKWNNDTKALAQYYSLFDYENTKAVDDYTVDITVKYNYPFLPLDLCHGAYFICVEKSVETIGGKEATQLNPGAHTGPYKMTELDSVSQVCYAERRDDYWGIAPYYKYIEVHTVTDANARAMGVESGEYNFVMNPASATVEAADGKTSKGWYVPAVGRFYYLNFNSNRDMMNVKEVRQAISLAINYEAMLQISNAGHGVLSDSALGSPLNPYSYTPASDPSNCYVGRTDVEQAKKLLAEAGYPDGMHLVCIYSGSDAQSISNTELMKNHLAQIGIDVELSPFDSGTFVSKSLSGEWDMRLTVAGNANPKRILNMLDGRRQPMDTVSGCCGENWYPDFDKVESLIDRCVQTVDDAERTKAFTEFNDLLREYVPMTVLYCPYVTFLTSADIDNLPIGSQGGPEVCRIFPNEYLEG